MKRIFALTAFATTLSLLSGCGLHFRSQRDFAPQLHSAKLINNSGETQIAKNISSQLNALGMKAKTKPTSTITLDSYTFNQSPPSISDDNTPIYDSRNAIICFTVRNTVKIKSKGLHICVNQSESNLTDTASAFNPSNTATYKQTINKALAAAVMQRLQNPDVWNYFE